MGWIFETPGRNLQMTSGIPNSVTKAEQSSWPNNAPMAQGKAMVDMGEEDAAAVADEAAAAVEEAVHGTMVTADNNNKPITTVW